MDTRTALLNDLRAEVGTDPHSSTSARAAVRSGPRSRLRRLALVTAVVPIASLGSVFAASAPASADGGCSLPDAEPQSQTKQCVGISHYTHEYLRTTTTGHPTRPKICYDFKSYGWMIGCQETVGPFYNTVCR